MPEFTALTDLATVKAQLGIATGNTTSDSLLGTMIKAVSAAISTYCNRNFGSASYTETYDGDDTQYVWLNQRPVTAVSSVTVNDQTVTARPAGQSQATGYVFDQNKLYYTGDIFPLGFQNVTVTYTAGLNISSTNYPDLWNAAAVWVAYLYKAQQHVDKQSDGGIEGQSTTYIKDMPWDVRLTVDKYRQVSPVQSLGN